MGTSKTNKVPSSHRMLLEHDCYYGLGMDALVTILVTVFSWNTNRIMVWAWMLLEHDRYYGLGMDALASYALGIGLGMDALVTGCSWNRNVMRWSPHAHVAPKSLNPHKH